MVKTPSDYQWSSYSKNALGKADPLIKQHAVFKRLGSTANERRKSYKQLFDHAVSASDLTAIRDCLQTGTPLVTERFQENIEQKLKIKVGYRQRGRPRILDKNN
jgi:putative transposase